MGKEKRIARIFGEATGKYHICDDALDYLDARGRAYDSRRQAIASLRADLRDYPPEAGCYTHYRVGNRIAKIIK